MTSETVGTLFSHISRRNSDMKNNNVITNSAEFGLIPQRDFFDKDIAVEGNTDKYYIIGRGDFVYNPRKSTTAPYGPFNCYQGEEEGIVSPLYTCLKPLYPEMADYLLWYFRSPAWYSYIYHNGAQGGARHDRVGMTNDLMDGIPVNLPCKTEQKKISEFLTLLDKRISAQRRLVESLKSYKRGALSKLFPKKGASIPERRFAGFSGDWKQRKLGDEATEMIAGGDVDKSLLCEEGNYPVIANALTGDGIIGYYKEQYRIKAPAVTVTGRGDVGHAKARNIDFTPVVRLLSIKSNHNPLFLENAINTLQIVIESTGVPQLTVPQLAKYELMFPKTAEEEMQIGNFFASLDNLITLHQQKVSITEKIKIGLLQGLFI